MSPERGVAPLRRVLAAAGLTSVVYVISIIGAEYVHAAAWWLAYLSLGAVGVVAGIRVGIRSFEQDDRPILESAGRSLVDWALLFPVSFVSLVVALVVSVVTVLPSTEPAFTGFLYGTSLLVTATVFPVVYLVVLVLTLCYEGVKRYLEDEQRATG